MATRESNGVSCAHRVSDQIEAPKADGIDEGQDVVQPPRPRVVVRMVGFSVPALVWHEHVADDGELRDERVVERAGQPRTVEEDERR
jgi:hypothetical protein